MEERSVKPLPVPVKRSGLENRYYIYLCQCGHGVQASWNYCPICGRRLEWGEDETN